MNKLHYYQQRHLFIYRVTQTYKQQHVMTEIKCPQKELNSLLVANDT